MAAVARHRGGSRFGASQWLALAGASRSCSGSPSRWASSWAGSGAALDRRRRRRMEAARKPRWPRGAAGSPSRSGAAARPQEKLTFYQTLTAPIGPTGSSAQPRAGARTGRARARQPRAAAASAPPSPAPAARRRRGRRRAVDRRAAELERAGRRLPQPQQAEACRSSSRRRALRAQSAAAAEDGQPRYRVRVGGARSRDEALRLAERVRARCRSRPSSPPTEAPMPEPPRPRPDLARRDRRADRPSSAGDRARLRGPNPVLVGVLKGAPSSSPTSSAPLPCRSPSTSWASRPTAAGARSSGIVRLAADLSISIEGRDVLIVEDIVDTGRTLDYLRRNLATRHPRSVRCACCSTRSSAARWT